VLWLFGVDFAASLAICLLVLLPLLLPASSSLSPPLSSSMHLASPMFLLLLSRDFCRPSRGEWVEAGEAWMWGATTTPSLRVQPGAFIVFSQAHPEPTFLHVAKSPSNRPQPDIIMDERRPVAFLSSCSSKRPAPTPGALPSEVKPEELKPWGLCDTALGICSSVALRDQLQRRQQHQAQRHKWQR
jgi:hypothetical protein